MSEWTRNENDPTTGEAVRWHPSDLDRCEHGRHSIDSCFDCPGGQSAGNVFLLAHTRTVRVAADGREEVRIGTMVHGEPIWVKPSREPR
jgi:hypothetical protein